MFWSSKSRVFKSAKVPMKKREDIWSNHPFSTGSSLCPNVSPRLSWNLSRMTIKLQLCLSGAAVIGLTQGVIAHSVDLLQSPKRKPRNLLFLFLLTEWLQFSYFAYFRFSAQAGIMKSCTDLSSSPTQQNVFKLPLHRSIHNPINYRVDPSRDARKQHGHRL